MRTRPTIRPRGFVAALLAVLSALALAACGGGGGTTSATSGSNGSSASTSGTSSSGMSASSTTGGSSGSTSGGSTGARTPPSTSTTEASKTSAPANRYGSYTRASAAAAERRAEAVQAARHRALAKKAGKAAPFLVPVGDNSIPTYGSEASSSEQAQAGASLAAYLEARADGEWGAACDHMAATVQKQLALLAGTSSSSANGDGCAQAYAKLSSRTPASERTNPLIGGLTALRVEGDKAFALFYGPHNQKYMMPMVSEAGTWKANQLAPLTWPIGAPPGG